jgi:hypothetical protein
LVDFFGAAFFPFLAAFFRADFAFLDAFADFDCLAAFFTVFFGADFLAAIFLAAFLTVFFRAVSLAGAFAVRAVAAATRLLAR